MSPYLTGNGGGSSCGSGSGAALGALPFAISEETWGSIVSPCRENHISGHLSSYGTFSRGGASILSPTMDHFGFHSRWLKDYGVIMNAGRTGADPLDADSTAFEFVDPASIDLSTIKVLIVTGDGKPEYVDGSWTWNGAVPLGSKLGWKWKERMDLVAEAFDAAGVPYDTVDFSESTTALCTPVEPQTPV
jgi:Asp-tRNA(Asn)/Glu-tRNA(Gln) amidotransferase A subunit family amidase